MKNIFWITALALLGGNAFAASPFDEPIFALPFGKQLERRLVSCGGDSPSLDDYCSRDVDVFIGVVSRRLVLRRPDFDTRLRIPDWIRLDGEIEVDVNRDGVLDSITVRTQGPAYQAMIIESISGRFGPATSSVPREAMNAMGAKWSVTKANWKLPDGTISFDCYSITECQLSIRTNAAEERYKVELLQRLQKNKM